MDYVRLLWLKMSLELLLYRWLENDGHQGVQPAMILRKSAKADFITADYILSCFFWVGKVYPGVAWSFPDHEGRPAAHITSR